MISDPGSIRLPTAQLDWSGDAEPVSLDYHDRYFSTGNGLAESEYVFLGLNRLAERFAALPDQPGTEFALGETGFGSGLNFLLSWRLWRQTAPKSASLCYASVEAHPMTRTDLARALSAWPGLQDFATQLIAQWPAPLRGQHLLRFDQGRVRLILCFDEAANALDQLLTSTSSLSLERTDGKFDAWFLDGFAPSRNPAMWSDSVFEGVAALSNEGASLSSFTAAGPVRHRLARVGFRVEKVAGFGVKRESIKAILQSPDYANKVLESKNETPWHWQPSFSNSERRAVVIGAGIAGACTARAMAERGWQVQVIERAQIASGASGNWQAVIHLRLPLRDSSHGQFMRSCFGYAQRYYRELQERGENGVHLDGVLQLIEPGPRLAQLKSLYAGMSDWIHFVDTDEASQLAGVRSSIPGVWLPGAGWLEPRLVCFGLLDHPLISVRCDCRVTALEHAGGDAWQLTLRHAGTLRARTIVLANAQDAEALCDLRMLRLRRIAGQLTRLPASVGPRCALCANAFTAPLLDGKLSIGASYRLDDIAPEVRDSDHEENLAALRAMSSDFAQIDVAKTELEGRTGIRCGSRDYLPVVGAMPNEEPFVDAYAMLGKNARRAVDIAAPALPGLYLNIAHGSRGFSTAPLCAEILAAQIDGRIVPVPRHLQRAISPARFLVRRIIRGLEP